jgi:thioredoxin 1
MIEVTDENFEEVVLKSKSPVVVDFWAEWCGPCLQMLRTLGDIEEEYGDEVTIAKCNVDEQTSVATQFGIRSIPYLVFFKDGEPVDTLVGNQTKEKVDCFIEKALVC